MANAEILLNIEYLDVKQYDKIKNILSAVLTIISEEPVMVPPCKAFSDITARLQ